MANTKKIKIASLFNLLIFALAGVASFGMIFGFMRIDLDSVLMDSNLAALKFFTVDSNILMGIIGLVAFIQERKSQEISAKLAGWLLLGTTGVTLTMLVTVFFLAPTFDNPLDLFRGSNFFLHLIVPILSIVNFLVFEKTGTLKIKDTVFALAPVVVYGTAYLINIIIHMDGGEVSSKYDWYGFMALGEKAIIFGLPGMLIIAWLIAFALFKSNNTAKKNTA